MAILEGAAKMELLRKCLKLKEYAPGKSIEDVKRRYRLKRVIKLASNENPYGASPEVLRAVGEFRDFHTYPDPEYKDLRELISNYTGWEYDRIVVGAGEDGILETLFRILLDEGDEVLIPVPTFPYYHNLTLLACGREVLYFRNPERNFQVGEDIIELISEKTKLILFSNPNNPTGNTEREEVLKAVIEVAEEKDALVFLDGAYAEFADRIFEPDESNVIIARTFSKAFGLANLRVGYACLPEWLVKPFRVASTPFPISTLAERAAIAALDDLKWMKECVMKIREERQRVYEEIRKLVDVYPSQANFLFFRSPAENLVEEMMKRGVILRDFSGVMGENYVRVSIGRREENDFFLKWLKDILKAE